MRVKPFVIIVEDNLANQMLASTVLERDGFRTELTDSPIDALERIGQARPDLVLMDIQLPGIDGLSLARTLKGSPATAGIPIVAFTAHAMIGDEESAIAAGCAGYISKPIDTRTFARQVRAFLVEASETSEVPSL
jgi:CheY-like chemotaxis protein